MNRNKSIRVAILCLSLAMAGSLPIDAQKVTFHEGSISLKQAFEKLESSSAYKIANWTCRERSRWIRKTWKYCRSYHSC